MLGVMTTLVALSVGGVLGAVAGYFGGLTDDVIMRLMDVLTSVPNLLLSLAIVSALGAGIRNLVIAITISRVPAFVRIVRSAVLSIVDQEFIEAAKAGGTSDTRIIVRHVIPNAMGPIIVQATMSISMLILQAAGLSFLGMGVQPPRPEWGAMLNDAREFMRVAPHMMLFPGMAIVLSALSFNLVGDGLRDALDPKLKS
jgi:peptide/nickel transport system permease protein